jgi:hypothetical protein
MEPAGDVLVDNFSSSSANSFTFQGYNVVMAISAAWSKANPVKRTVKREREAMSCSRLSGATGPLAEEDVGAMAKHFSGRRRRGGIVASNILVICWVSDLFLFLILLLYLILLV